MLHVSCCTFVLLLPKLAIFYRISVERSQFQGPLEIQNYHPPLIFGDLTPPIPVPNLALVGNKTAEKKKEIFQNSFAKRRVL